MKDAKKDILWRVYLVYFVMLIFGLLIVGKIIFIQVKEGPKLRAIAESQEIIEVTLEASRGNILAADGSLLATSVPVFEVRMDVASTLISDQFFYRNVDSLAAGLSQVLDTKSQSRFKSDLVKARKKGNRYHLLGKKVTYEQLKEIRTLPILRRGKYRGGLIAIQSTRREMPFKELAQRTIGYEIKNADLFVGLEGAYSEYLTGKEGKQVMRRINNGDLIPIHDENEVDPKDGLDIVTTIDVNIQDIAEHALLRQMMNHGAFQGCAVIMEVESGSVRAIANLRYDSSDNKYKEIYNYAIGESIEPGSTFKLPNIIAALEDGGIRLTDSVITGNGFIMMNGIPVQDVKKIGNGRVTVREVFEFSSNVGMVKVMDRAFGHQPEKYIDRLYSMSLNQPLGIEILGEGKPYIKHPSNKQVWWGTSLTVLSFGYELQLTPLQTLAFYNAVANDGKLMKPMFVTEVRDGISTKKKFKPQVINKKIASENTIDLAQSLLEGVIERGTGRNVFKDSPYKIAGKTGTAKIAGKGGYKNEYNASFVGYFPADRPKFSCIVVINKPTRGKYYGGSVAAPAFKEIADKLYSTMLAFEFSDQDENITPHHPEKNIPATYPELKTIYAALNIPVADYLHDVQWASAILIEEKLMFESAEFNEKKVPDVLGMKARDAVFLLENMGMKTRLSGRGMVKAQSVKAGSEIKKGQKINLQLAAY